MPRSIHAIFHFLYRFVWAASNSLLIPKGLARQLLVFMEAQMISKGLTTAYTIARARSIGMNITFAQQEYQYNGRLINNTQISGQTESMNVWSKPLV